MEVAEIIGMMDFVQEVNVYGVSIKSKTFLVVREYKMNIVISLSIFSVLATECILICKEINGVNSAIQAFLQRFEISVSIKCCI